MSGVLSEPPDDDGVQRYCRHCSDPVQLITFTGFAGKGDPRPYRHAVGVKTTCSLATLSSEDVTTEGSPDIW